MAGYFTQTRSILPRGRITSRKNSQVTYSDCANVLPALGGKNPVQITYSFRSVGGGSSPDPLEDSLLSGGTLGSTFGKLRADQKRTPNPGDTGHEFSTSLEHLSLSEWVLRWKNGADSYVQSGPIILSGIPTMGNGGFPPLPPLNTSYFGPLAISLTKPTNPNVNLAVTLTELLKDGLPALPGRNLSQSSAPLPKKLAGEYLNKEFGIDPLLSDLSKTLQTVQRSKKILDNFQAASGRVVRRSFAFDPIVETGPVQDLGNMTFRFLGSTFYLPFDLAAFFGDPGIFPLARVYRRRSTKITYWFSGGYTYHVSTSNSLKGNLRELEQKANRLFGTRIDPSTLWQVGPWSWLADWQANIGANISNAVALQNDSLVLKYGYLMCTREVTDEYTWRSLNKFLGTESVSGTCSFTSTSKVRVRATPYGFGLNPGSFTLRQWAILGALGLTKAPNSLF
jgi:hypothetical protein